MAGQIKAIKGRIAEGTPWAARDKDGGLYFYSDKPTGNVKENFFAMTTRILERALMVMISSPTITALYTCRI